MVKPVTAYPACKTVPRPSWTVSPQQNQMTTPAVDEVKRRLIQQQLVLLLHADFCKKKDDSQEHRNECQLPHCRIMKNILRHMTVCSAGRACQFAHCSSSKQIISHFKHCVNSVCPVCIPIRRFDRAHSNAVQTTLSTNPSQNAVPAPLSLTRTNNLIGTATQVQLPPTQQIDQTIGDSLSHNVNPDVSSSSSANSSQNAVPALLPLTQPNSSVGTATQVQIPPTEQMDETIDDPSNHNVNPNTSASPSTNPSQSMIPALLPLTQPNNSTGTASLVQIPPPEQMDQTIDDPPSHNANPDSTSSSTNAPENAVLAPLPLTQPNSSVEAVSQIQIPATEQMDQMIDGPPSQNVNRDISSLPMEESSLEEIRGSINVELSPQPSTSREGVGISSVAVHSNTNSIISDNSVSNSIPIVDRHTSSPPMEESRLEEIRGNVNVELSPQPSTSRQDAVTSSISDDSVSNSIPIVDRHTSSLPMEESRLEEIRGSVNVELSPQPSTSRQDAGTSSVAVHSNTNSIQSQPSQNLQPNVEIQQQTLDDSAAGPSNPSPNISNKQLPNRTGTSNIQLLINAMSIKIQSNITKEWHKSIRAQHRETSIRTMALKIFPSTWTGLLSPQIMLSFLTLLEKEERNIYETANSIKEYSRKFAEKCYEVHRELIERHRAYRERRLQQQQSQSQTVQPNVEEMVQQQQSEEPNVEMAEQQQQNNPVVEPLPSCSNSNISDNQSSNPIPSTSYIVPQVNNTSTNEQQNVSKEWHNDIGTEFREILINEFVRKILAVRDSEVVVNNSEQSATTIDVRLKLYVENAEKDIYQRADSRMEYYDLLADKYFKILSELQKENFARMEL